MKLSILLPFVILFCNSMFHVTKKFSKETNVVNDTIFAKFEYRLPAKSGKISILLYKDGSYKYLLNTHLYQHFSEGKWKISKNTLVLNSSIQKTELPISLIKSQSNNDSEFIKVAWVTNRNGEILKEAMLFVNYDTSKYCMPIFGNDCKIKRHELRSIQVRLNDGIASKWYAIESNDSLDQMKITVDLDFHTDAYVFFHNKIFKIVDNKLYETKSEEFYEMNSKKPKEVIDYTHYFKRIK